MRSTDDYKEIFNLICDPVVLVDVKSGRILEANRAAVEMYGYSYNELLQMCSTDVSSEPEKTQQAMAVYQPKIPVRYHRKKDGTVFPVEINVRQHTWNGCNIHLCVLREISQQLAVETALRESEEKYRVLLEESSDSIFSLTPQGQYLYVNRAFSRSVGKPTHEIIGKTLWQVFPKDEADKRFVSLSRAFSTRKMEVIEVKFTGEDGDRYFMTTITPVIDEKGEIISAVCASRNITRLKCTEITLQEMAIKLEEQKRELQSVNENLEQRVKEGTEKLHQSQKLESIGRLAGGIAHDFNNKLSVIMGYTELASDKLPETSELQGYLQEITRAAEFSRDITSQLLAFSRQQIVSPRTIDVNHIIAETIKPLSRLIGEDVRLEFLKGENIWSIRMDPVQVDQIIMNLAVNARDAMSAGGTLTIQTANHLVGAQEAAHTGHPQGKYVKITVRDTGVGMDEKTVMHIFEPFFTTKEVGKGTGLGLATIHGIVLQNKGFIDVESAPGVGTAFQLYLPHFSETSGVLSTTDSFLQKNSGSILLVEDDESVRRITAILLEQAGFKVTPCATPQEALQRYVRGDNGYDLILSDIVMPGMNGNEMIEQIKAIDSKVKVLFMSGYSSEFINQKGAWAEQANIINKPVDTRELKKKINQLMNA